uniref:Uncharacterized protein n=1 Tax=Megaselia scalaris TaxID=36166 RepID=T1GW51_MEGSC
MSFHLQLFKSLMKETLLGIDVDLSGIKGRKPSHLRHIWKLEFVQRLWLNSSICRKEDLYEFLEWFRIRDKIWKTN